MFDKTGVHSHLVVGCRNYYSVEKALETQNDLTLQNTAARAVTSVDRREPVRKFQMRTHFFCCTSLHPIKRATALLPLLEKSSQNFSSSSFVILANLLHP